MASSLDIARAMTAGMAPPTGDSDVALHTGKILTWDRQTGVNTVDVSGTVLSNLDSLQGGLPNSYTPGDVVLLARKQSRYFIMGRVASATGLAGSAPESNVNNNSIVEYTTNTLWADLPAPNITPSVTVYIGSSRKALVLWQSQIHAQSGAGYVAWGISGASTALPGQFSNTYTRAGTWRSLADPTIITYDTVMGMYLATVNPGLNTFTMKFQTEMFSAAGLVTIQEPGIVVIPM